MSDRIHSFTVVLDDVVSDDEAAQTTAAILRLRGVLDVVPQVADGGFYVAREQAKSALRHRIFAALAGRDP